MINNENIEQVKRLLKNEQNPKIIVAQNDEFNRKILEYGKFDIILSLEKGNRKNKIRQEDSGLNHVVANIAYKNKVAIGINLEEISKLQKKEKAERISKIIQNLKVCKKSKTKIAIKTENLQKARNFLSGLGASTQQLKETIVF